MTKYFNGFESATGDTAFNAATGTGTQTSSPSPSTVGGTTYGVCTAAAGTVGFNRWTLDSQGAWQFRRLIYLGAGTGTNGAVNADLDIWRTLQNASGTLATGGLIRVTAAGVLALRDTAASQTIASTTVVPTGDWYRLEGYGNSVNNTGRVALFAIGSSTALIDLQPSSWSQGAFALSQVQLGKTGTGTGYAGLVAFDREEFYTGTDATSAFLGPYAATTTPLSSTTAVSPTSGTAPLAVTSTVTAAGGNGGTVTYDWAWGDGSTTAAQASNSATHTYSAAGSYTITGAANQS